MKAVKTDTCNCILKGNDNNVDDLPVTQFEYSGGTPAVQSCWEMGLLERIKVLFTGRIYFTCWGRTHPPILLTAEPECEPKTKKCKGECLD